MISILAALHSLAALVRALAANPDPSLLLLLLRLLLLPQRRGFRPYVLPVERKDWFKVGRALLTAAYWRGSCTTEPGCGPDAALL